MNWLFYLLQVNLYLVLFFGFYRFFLAKETFFNTNRGYLVLSAALSFFIPVMQFAWVRKLFVAEGVHDSVVNLYAMQGTLIRPSVEVSGMNWGQLLAFVYITGVLIALIRFSLNLVYLGKLMRGKLKGELSNQAFSFFGFLSVTNDLPKRSTIVQHEYVHIRQLHSADVLLFELVAIFNWFNPIVYAYKQSIRLIHEFIADEIASQEEASKADYALLLFHQQFGLQPVPLTNTFFNPSLLKLRIAMLQKERSDRDSLLKYGFIAPLFLLMLTLSSATLATKSLAKVEKQMEEISKQTVAPKVPTRTAQEVLANDGINLSSAFIVSPSIAEEMNTKGKKVDETDQPASFKGGLEGLAMYLSTNLKYPAEAQAKKITGKVYIQLVVNVNGKASDFKVLKGLGGGCQEEALRVLQQVEGWIPALSKGKSVSSTLVIPINFML